MNTSPGPAPARAGRQPLLEPRAARSEAISDAKALAPADPRVAGTAAAGDQRALVRSILGTGIGVATLTRRSV